MNYAQARRAVAAKFGEHAFIEHARREKKSIQYRVFLKSEPRPSCIGVGTSWKRAVEMAMNAEVTRAPVVAPSLPASPQSGIQMPSDLQFTVRDSVAAPVAGCTTIPASDSQVEARVTAAVTGPGAALDAAVAEAKEPERPQVMTLQGESRIATWADMAVIAVKKLAQAGAFNTDDVWAALDGDGIERPTDSRALGQVMQRLKREGLIKPTGETVPTKQKSRHRAPIAVWMGTPSR